jgi:hypothetical protein
VDPGNGGPVRGGGAVQDQRVAAEIPTLAVRVTGTDVRAGASTR